MENWWPENDKLSQNYLLSVKERVVLIIYSYFPMRRISSVLFGSTAISPILSRWRRLPQINCCHQHDGIWNKAARCHGLPSQEIKIIKEDSSIWMHQMHHILLECYQKKSWFCLSKCKLKIVIKILYLYLLFKKIFEIRNHTSLDNDASLVQLRQVQNIQISGGYLFFMVFHLPK